MSLTRRDFLAASLGTPALLALGGGVPGFLVRTARAAEAHRDAGDTILVVVQLAGGNDGLNTVVPYGDDGYGRNRTTLRLPAAKLHKIDSLLGFHPEMQGFDRLYKEGRLTVVQGVGYPRHSDQHGQAMRDWQSAQPKLTSGESGWIGRTVDRAIRSGETTTPAVFVGELKQPFSLNAQQAVVPSLRGLDDWILRKPTALAPTAMDPAKSDSLYDFVRSASDAAQRASRRIESLKGEFRTETPVSDALGRVGSPAKNPTLRSASEPASGASAPVAQPGLSGVKASDGGGDYPAFQLAERLRTISQLIRADLGIRIFCTELGGQEPGGFDNHAGQRDNHASLLRQLSDSVAAFCDDLRRQNLLDRVVLMTFSEFGRAVAENGRRGTDHGSAAPMFLAGGKLRGGLVGAHPSLTDLDNGGLRFHTDFRRVYATLLDRWLGFPSQPILGQQYEPLQLIA